MQTMIRHLGIPVTSRKEATKFWQQMGLNIVNDGFEEWGSKKLSITKLCDIYGGQIELIKGDWPYHVAIGVNEFPMGLEMIHYKSKDRIEVAFYKVPGGGVVEMVRAK